MNDFSPRVQVDAQVERVVTLWTWFQSGKSPTMRQAVTHPVPKTPVTCHPC